MPQWYVQSNQSGYFFNTSPGTQETPFAGVDKMIQENFFPRLFFGQTKTLSPIVGSLSTMPVKKSGLGILNPVTSAQEKYISYQQESAELVRAVTGGGEFSNADHLRTLSEESRDIKKDRDAVY